MEAFVSALGFGVPRLAVKDVNTQPDQPRGKGRKRRVGHRAPGAAVVHQEPLGQSAGSERRRHTRFHILEQPHFVRQVHQRGYAPKSRNGLRLADLYANRSCRFDP
jgi:hypothetical protein